MRIYHVYCYNRDKASNLRRQLLRTNPLWQKFVQVRFSVLFHNTLISHSHYQSCQSKPECNNLDLAAYLIMPVQRIPRYQLLVKVRSNCYEKGEMFDSRHHQELLKCTPEGNERRDLSKALSMIVALTRELDMCAASSRLSLVRIG